MGYWREMARPIINTVINEVGFKDEKALRKALREAYPFGQRKNWPYKVWLDEISIQTGQKKDLGNNDIYGTPLLDRLKKDKDE